MDEAVVLCRVHADPAAPTEVANLALYVARIEREGLPLGDDAEVARVAERVLAMRRDVVPLLAQHLVELGATVAADELDPRSDVLRGELPEQPEEALVQRMPRAGDPIREQRL